jgi:N-acetylneuraminate synthase/pseudaminic acid synthase
MNDNQGSNSFKIDGVTIGINAPCYIIAEMSGNHDGRIEEAIKIIHAAKAAGANAVKLQTYRADTITLNSSKGDFNLPEKNPWEDFNTLYSLYEKAHTPWEWHETLFKEARQVGITIFSSPFDETSVDLLEDLGAPAYKIASPEITDIPLIKKVSKTGKPVILSTGVADFNDIALAVDTLRQNNCEDFAILRCTTAYPAPIEETNLALIPDISRQFDCVAGLSDHSVGDVVPMASIHYGAKIIEKHFVLNRTESVDGFFSSDQDQFKQLVDHIRMSEKCIGTVNYAITPSAQKNIFARRSIYISADVKAGDIISPENIKSVRPGFGLHPKYYNSVIGMRFTRDRTLGDRLTQEDISNFTIEIED